MKKQVTSNIDIAKSLVVGVLLFWVSLSVYALNWVDLLPPNDSDDDDFGPVLYAYIDTDSIRKGNDGLVYYTEDLGGGKTEIAYNCQEHIHYLLGYADTKFPDWKSKGLKIEPDMVAAITSRYACSRAR